MPSGKQCSLRTSWQLVFSLGAASETKSLLLQPPHQSLGCLFYHETGSGPNFLWTALEMTCYNHTVLNYTAVPLTCTQQIQKLHLHYASKREKKKETTTTKPSKWQISSSNLTWLQIQRSSSLIMCVYSIEVKIPRSAWAN